jgi:glycolate oxidase
MSGSIAEPSAKLLDELATVGGLVTDPEILEGYRRDQCAPDLIPNGRPAALVRPRTTAEVQRAVRAAASHGVPIVPRGAGSGLSGGAAAVDGCVVLSLEAMTDIAIDESSLVATAQAGVLNGDLKRSAAEVGLFYPPDPASSEFCTIGGNVATNAGGPHTLKYGVTINHVLGLEVVLSDGAIVQIGPLEDPAELDLAGVLVGSEGRLGIVTKVWVRLTPNPQDFRALRAVFGTVDEATQAVSRVIAAGIIPAAMELMDRGILDAVEDAYHFGFPRDAAAVLIIEVDGPTAGLDEKQRRIVNICREANAREIIQAASAAERETLWKCRKMAVGATGRLSPSYLIEDGVVPRTKLPHILRRIGEIGAKHGVRIVNVAHAGDGNVHPVLLFDEENRAEVERARAAGSELLTECIACGGSVTAEHGIGVEKLELMDKLFAPGDLAAMHAVRSAFDPRGLLNPGKLLKD